MNEQIGCVEVRWSEDGDPDDVVAPWAPPNITKRILRDEWERSRPVMVHVERMDDNDIWMCIYDGETGEDVHMWFHSKKPIEWTVRDHKAPAEASAG